MEINYPNTYLVWDLETNGLYPGQNQVLEIGAMVVIDGAIVERRNWVLNNKVPVPAKITEITGFTDEIIAQEGQDPVKCLTEFYNLASQFETHLTHNGIRFDIPFFLAQYNQQVHNAKVDNLVPAWEKKMIDTAALYKGEYVLKVKREWNEDFLTYAKSVLDARVYGKFNLGHVCDTLGIDRSTITQHRALGDIQLTHLIYQYLRNKYYGNPTSDIQAGGASEPKEGPIGSTQAQTLGRDTKNDSY